VKASKLGGQGITEVGKEFVKQGSLAFDNPVKLKPTFSTRRKWVYLGIPTVNAGDCGGSSSFKSLRIPVVPFFQTWSSVTAVKLGDVTIMSWPGEPSTSLGWALMNKAKSQGHNDPWVFALTNDYMTYFVNKEESKESVYDSCSSLFRWRGGARIIKKHSKLLDELI
jgi:hypothetical protein